MQSCNEYICNSRCHNEQPLHTAGLGSIWLPPANVLQHCKHLHNTLYIFVFAVLLLLWKAFRLAQYINCSDRALTFRSKWEQEFCTSCKQQLVYKRTFCTTAQIVRNTSATRGGLGMVTCMDLSPLQCKRWLWHVPKFFFPLPSSNSMWQWQWPS